MKGSYIERSAVREIIINSVEISGDATTDLINDVDALEITTIDQFEREIERLHERCLAYKGQVEAGAAEIERLRAALAPFARYYDLNDCQERAKIPDNALEVPIADLLAAKVALTPHDTMFTCCRCEANYSVEHLEQPVTECPVCGWKRRQEQSPHFRWSSDMIAQKLRDMHALAADSCDPEYNRALLEAAAEIDKLIIDRGRLRALIQKVLAYRRGEGKFNFSRYWLSQERDIAMMEAWEQIEAELDAALTPHQTQADSK